MAIPPEDIKVILCGAEQLNIRETMEYNNNEGKYDDDEYAAGRGEVEAKEDPFDSSDEGDDTSEEEEEEGKTSRALKGRKSKSHADGSDDMDADIKAEYQRRLQSSKVRAPKGGSSQHVVISKPGQRIKVGRAKRASM